MICHFCKEKMNELYWGKDHPNYYISKWVKIDYECFNFGGHPGECYFHIDYDYNKQEYFYNLNYLKFSEKQFEKYLKLMAFV